MLPTHSGAFRLFRFAGIDVFLHWTWFLAAAYFLTPSGGSASNFSLNLAAYLSLFAIVLLHEFGHAFAARQVGGESREIVLWPLGGIAFAKVPPRPGAELWAVAAGPLVNVVLFPLLWAALEFALDNGWQHSRPELTAYLATIFWINKGLLIFNVLPIYPLDGGQLLRSLLWYKLGRAQSLHVATIVGFIGIPVALAWQYSEGKLSLFQGVIALFIAAECHRGFKQAQLMKKVAALPRHSGFGCPTCRERPPGGPLWGCPHCNHGFDPFSTHGVCPHCAQAMPKITCAYCGSAHEVERWGVTSPRRPGDPPVIEV